MGKILNSRQKQQQIRAHKSQTECSLVDTLTVSNKDESFHEELDDIW